MGPHQGVIILLRFDTVMLTLIVCQSIPPGERGLDTEL